MNELFPGHSAGGQTAADNVLEGLNHWAKTSSWAIVSTKPGSLKGFYEYLMPRKPKELGIIGGVSTYSLPGCTDKANSSTYNFADAEEWRRITERCLHISRVTGCRTVLLENETALRRFYGGEAIDLAALRQALIPLRESGLTILWYLPTIAEPTKSDPNRTQRTASLVQTIHKALPNARFVVGHIGYPDWKNDKTLDWRRQVMLGAFPCVEYLFATHDGIYKGARKPVWTPDSAIAEADRLNLDSLIIYPGFYAWAETARSFAGLAAKQ